MCLWWEGTDGGRRMPREAGQAVTGRGAGKLLTARGRVVSSELLAASHLGDRPVPRRGGTGEVVSLYRALIYRWRAEAGRWA